MLSLDHNTLLDDLLKVNSLFDAAFGGKGTLLLHLSKDGSITNTCFYTDHGGNIYPLMEHNHRYPLLAKRAFSAMNLLFGKTAVFRKWKFRIPLRHLKLIANGDGAAALLDHRYTVLHRGTLSSDLVLGHGLAHKKLTPIQDALCSIVENIPTGTELLHLPKSAHAQFEWAERIGINILPHAIQVQDHLQKHIFQNALLVGCANEHLRVLYIQRNVGDETYPLYPIAIKSSHGTYAMLTQFPFLPSERIDPKQL